MKKFKVMMLCAMGLFIFGTVLGATEATTYVAVPMHMFKRLIGKGCDWKTPEYFTYQAGKLVKCNTDLQALKKECTEACASEKLCSQKGIKGCCDSPCRCRCVCKCNCGSACKCVCRCKGYRDHKIVLLTRDQMKEMMKQKLQKKIQEIDNSDSDMCKAVDKIVEKTPVVKVNGQDSKVISPIAVWKKLKQQN